MKCLRKAAAPALLIGLMILVASCGEQYEARQTAKKFLKESLKEPSELSGLSFQALDSTWLVSDKAIEAMRRSIEDSGLFNSTLEYADRGEERKLLMIRAEYHLGDSLHGSTFYLTADADGIVAFKQN